MKESKGCAGRAVRIAALTRIEIARRVSSSSHSGAIRLYLLRLIELSSSGITFHTGPFQKIEVGVSFHRACGAYRIASSQKKPFSSQQAGSGCPGFAILIRLSSEETICFGSQNCLARGSEIRPKLLPLGERQSVARIGSQTTSTRTFGSEWRSRSFSTAEAPRRHVAQVGDSSKTRRGASAASSKAASNSLKFAVESVKSGFCVGGVLEGPQ